MSTRMEPATRKYLIDPKLSSQGWFTPEWSVELEYPLGDGKIKYDGIDAERKSKVYSDYMLCCKPGLPCAAVEAKREGLDVTEGSPQAINYAFLAGAPVAYSTNGHQIFWYKVWEGEDGRAEFESKGPIDRFHTPEELWELYQEYKNFRSVTGNLDALFYPLHIDKTKSEPKKLRYYQRKAINNTCEFLARGENRVLLTMATGTGKTYTAAQLAHKLLRSDFIEGPILFLADRTVLRKNALDDFREVFNDEEIFVIKPGEELSKRRKVYFGIYQTMIGLNDEGENEKSSSIQYTDFEPNFFELIIIDECHRGKKQTTNDQDDAGPWYSLLEYFRESIQIGLTATPKREESNDTYDYFEGNIAITYSVRQGIEDGYLAPFITDSYLTNADEEGIRIEESDGIIDERGIPVPPGLYGPQDFNKLLLIPSYIRVYVKKLLQHMMTTVPNGKTIVFCVDTAHAARVAEIINQEFDKLKETYKELSGYPSGRYAKRITGAEKDARGEYPDFDRFKKPDSKDPIIVTTSKLLTTGINVKNLRNVVFMTQVGSLVEFKQIMGRGTRIYENKEDPRLNKYGFYMIAYGNSSLDHLEGDWDGEPTPQDPKSASSTRERPIGERIRYFMSDDFREGEIEITQNETAFFTPDGNMISAEDYIQQQIDLFFEHFENLDKILERFSTVKNKRDLLEFISKETDISLNQIKKYFKNNRNTKNLKIDIFDIIANCIYEKNFITKEERVEEFIKNREWYQQLNSSQKEAIDTILRAYINDDTEPFIPGQNFWIMKEFDIISEEEIEKRLGGVEELDKFLELIGKDLYVR